MDVDTFCRTCIDPMGEESDHVQLVALTDALQVPLRVVYLDRSLAMGGSVGAPDLAMRVERPELAAGGVSFASAALGGAASTAGTVISGVAGGAAAMKPDMHDFSPEGGAAEPRIHLLYRPGHYDVLYPIQ